MRENGRERKRVREKGERCREKKGEREGERGMVERGHRSGEEIERERVG